MGTHASRKEGLIEGLIEGKIEGEIKGEMKLIRMLQEILHVSESVDADFEGKTLEQLQQQASELQEQVRHRQP